MPKSNEIKSITTPILKKIARTVNVIWSWYIKRPLLVLQSTTIENMDDIQGLVVIIVESMETKLVNKLISKLKKLYSFRDEYDKKRHTFLIVGSDGTVGFTVNHLVGSCMANIHERPLSIETALKCFDKLFPNPNARFITKLYRNEMERL